MGFRHKISTMTNLFNSFQIHMLTIGGSLGSFQGVISPKIEKNRSFISCYSQLLTIIDVKTLSMGFKHKIRIMTNLFNSFSFHIPITGGSPGLFQGVILPKIEKNRSFISYYSQLLTIIDVKTLLMGFKHKIRIMTNLFNSFSFHIPITGGSPGLFQGVILPKIEKNRSFISYYSQLLTIIDVKTLLMGFRHNISIMTNLFNSFLFHILTNGGSPGSFQGVIFPKIAKKRSFILCYSQ